MNENIDLTKILKDCPNGTKFYSSVWGEVYFEKILDREVYTIVIDTVSGYCHLTKEGYYIKSDDAECIIFPSKEQRDWSKFTAPWYKNRKFDPKTLKPFDRVLVRDNNDTENWSCDFFSYIGESDVYKYISINSGFKQCIPYNDDTKHLVGTTDEAYFTTKGGSIYSNEYKPYLFPLSSMTKEQKQEYQHITERWMYDSSYSISDSIDWLNAHHFDYRNLIQMNLAIDATGLNIY